MNSATDAPAETVSAPPRELPPPGGRPEHTLLSILILILLSAGALYLADWVLRDEGAVFEAWDFSAPLESGAWEFPDPDAARSEAGMTIEMAESGFGPKLNQSFPAASVNRIQAVVTAVHAETGEPVRFALGWYWARDTDVAASPEAPFAVNRAMAFYPFARHRRHTYRADMNTHELWNGTIASGVFTVKFPEDATGPFRVTVSRLEFLE